MVPPYKPYNKECEIGYSKVYVHYREGGTNGYYTNKNVQLNIQLVCREWICRFKRTTSGS